MTVFFVVLSWPKQNKKNCKKQVTRPARHPLRSEIGKRLQAHITRVNRRWLQLNLLLSSQLFRRTRAETLAIRAIWARSRWIRSQYWNFAAILPFRLSRSLENQTKIFFSVLRIITIICNYGCNGHENFFCFEERGGGEGGGKQGVLWVGFDRLC